MIRADRTARPRREGPGSRRRRAGWPCAVRTAKRPQRGLAALAGAAVERSLRGGGEAAGLPLARRLQADRAGRPVPADPARRRGWSIWARRRAAGPRWRCSAARRGWWRSTCCRSIRWRARSMLQGDFTDPTVPAAAVAALGGKADLVLSDMAPNTTGHAATDHLRIVALAEAALDVRRCDVLAEGGGFVAKVFQGGAERRCWTAQAALRHRAARQAAGQPQGIQRTLRGGERVPRHSRVSGNPSRSSARSTLISTA